MRNVTCPLAISIKLAVLLFGLSSPAWAADDSDNATKPICTVALISNPLVTSLSHEQLKDQRQEIARLPHRSRNGLASAIEMVNRLQPDAFVVLGSLTWSGSKADLELFNSYLPQIQSVPTYLVPGERDLIVQDKGDSVQDRVGELKKRFSSARVLFQEALVVCGVKFVLASSLSANKTLLDQIKWIDQQFETATSAKARLLIGGPQIEKQAGPWNAYWRVLRRRKVSVHLSAGLNHEVSMMGGFQPSFALPSSGWQKVWKLSVARVYSDRIELAMRQSDDQPEQVLTVPNLVNASRWPNVSDDPCGVLTYTEDLARNPDLTFVQLSDSQLDDGTDRKRAARYAFAPQMNRAAVQQVNRLNPPLVFMTGDLVNKNTLKEWNMYQEIYSKLKPPLYPLPGNHDILLTERALAKHLKDPEQIKSEPDLTRIWQENAAYARDKLAPLGFTGRLAFYEKFTGKPPYYSFERNGCVFICLDSSTAKMSNKQIDWLQQELERTKNAAHVFVLGHYPLLDSFSHNVQAADGASRALALFKRYKVAAYLFGHRHHYGYRLYAGTAHILCDDLCWGERVSYQIYHVFPDRIVACWKPIYRKVGLRPLYERVIFPEPRASVSAEASSQQP